MASNTDIDPAIIGTRCRQVLQALNLIHPMDARHEWAERQRTIIGNIDWPITRQQVRALEAASNKLRKWFPRIAFSGNLAPAPRTPRR